MLAGIAEYGYNPAVTTQAIQAYLEAVPFTPVDLVTSSGKSYRVPHPDFINFSPTGRTCFVFRDDGEAYSTLDVLTITEVVPIRRRPATRKKKG